MNTASSTASLSARNDGHAAPAILLVEDETRLAQSLQDALAQLGYRIAGVASEGAQAIAMARKLKPDLIVMDVELAGAMDGIQAARSILTRTSIPIVFLASHSEPQTLRRALRVGPLGYLLKPFRRNELHCAIEVALHKHRTDLAWREREAALLRSAERMQELSLVDELTQLKNRRGFFELAQHALKMARRQRYELVLFFMDLNGLKQINDNLGHLRGDQALRDTAAVLKQTFRASDILARIGGDEFVALAHVQASSQVATLQERLAEHLRRFNASTGRPYQLELSMGVTLADVAREESLESLLSRADAAMYAAKRAGARRS